MKKLDTSLHKPLKASNRYLSNKKLTLYIVRKGTGEYKMANSSPCLDCFMKMKEFNIRYIVYSGKNGEILKQRFRDYTPKIITLGRRYLNKTTENSSCSETCSASSSSSSNSSVLS